MSMQNPVVFPFLNEDDEDFAIDTAGSQIGNAVTDLQGIEALAIFGHLSAAAAASGSDVTVFIQTSFASGAWYDVACIVFGSATIARAANVSSAGAAPATLTDQAMADNTVLNGPIGDRLRAVVVVEGDFDSPSILALRGHAR